MPEKIQPADVAFFQAFGYLALPGALAGDYGWISDEFEQVWRDRPDIRHDGSQRTMFPALFIAQRPRLTALLEHPAVVAIADALLGEGWSLYGGDGNFYSGDTGWHSDCGPAQWQPKTTLRHLKIAFYLDPLTADTGALRVIPGSHHFGDRYADLLENGALSGRPGQSIPAQALPITPGDLIAFDHRLKHAAFGGAQRRRMFTINLLAPIRDAAQREAALTIFRHYRDIDGCTWDFGAAWLASLTPGQARRLAPAVDLGREVMAEARPVGSR
ncbi:MAG TPA: phytanoyl-CoA dioxygenase family protein [Planctomycetota bacterium]|nr:phytanoyl-CoA dioxygenase family protein [Planctomycetota bacterium]